VVCAAPTQPGIAKTNARLYCSNACKMVAYRRRRVAQRDEQARADYEAYLREVTQQHRDDWVAFLISDAAVSRKVAERTYEAMLAADRIEQPFPQQSLWSFAETLR